MGMHAFALVQGFCAIFLLGLIVFVLFAAGSALGAVAMGLFARPGKLSEPQPRPQLRLVPAEPKPEPRPAPRLEPQEDKSEWLKEFG
jgi:hypothetical protein